MQVPISSPVTSQSDPVVATMSTKVMPMSRMDLAESLLEKWWSMR
jgi:hypothetical protein